MYVVDEDEINFDIILGNINIFKQTVNTILSITSPAILLTKNIINPTLSMFSALYTNFLFKKYKIVTVTTKVITLATK